MKVIQSGKGKKLIVQLSREDLTHAIVKYTMRNLNKNLHKFPDDIETEYFGAEFKILTEPLCFWKVKGCLCKFFIKE